MTDTQRTGILSFAMHKPAEGMELAQASCQTTVNSSDAALSVTTLSAKATFGNVTVSLSCTFPQNVGKDQLRKALLNFARGTTDCL